MAQFIKCNKCGRYIDLNDPFDGIVEFLTRDGRGMNLCHRCIFFLDNEFDNDSWDKFLKDNNMLEEGE